MATTTAGEKDGAVGSLRSKVSLARTDATEKELDARVMGI